MQNFAKNDIFVGKGVIFAANAEKKRSMRYADFQNTFSLQMIYAGYYEAGKEWCYKDVISPFSRLYLVERGEGWVYMNGEKFHLQEGDLFLIPKFTYHAYQCDDYMSHYYICFLDQFIGEKSLFDCFRLRYQTRAGKLDECLMKRFLELNPDCQIVNPDPKSYDNRADLFEATHGKSLRELRSDLESKGILLQLFARFVEQEEPFAVQSFEQHVGMSKVFHYINSHLDHPITVRELAEVMCVSPDHFTRLFKNVNGMPPNRFVQMKRIERAQTLLLLSDLSIKEVAEAVGIPNLSQFSKLFHKMTGVAPRTFRK